MELGGVGPARVPQGVRVAIEAVGGLVSRLLAIGLEDARAELFQGGRGCRQAGTVDSGS